MKKMEWMVAAGTVAALAGATYSAGCVNTVSDCALLGTCGEGGRASTSSTSTSTGATTTTTGSGGMAPVPVCQSWHYGDVGEQAAHSVHVDATSNVFFAGESQGKLTIGSASSTSTGKDVFVAKVNPAWETLWLAHLPVSYGAVAYDLSGNVILAGAYGSVLDIGCPVQLSAADNLYVAKLSSEGSCLWAKGFDAPGASVRLAVDANGQIALAGDAMGAFTLHEGDAGPPPLTVGAGGGRDIFALTLDKDGKVLSSVAYGGASDDVVHAVTTDTLGGMVIAGSFKSLELDFSTGKNPPTSNGTLEQAFVARIKGNGATWAVGFPGDGDQAATGVAMVGDTPVVAGRFAKSIDLGGMDKATATGEQDLFLVGLKVSPVPPTVAWRQTFLGKGTKTITDLATNGADALALTGAINGDVDFGAGVVAGGGIYYAKLASADGKALSVHAFGGSDGALAAGGVALDAAGVYVAGAFGAPLDLGDAMPLKSAGATDIFVAQFCP